MENFPRKPAGKTPKKEKKKADFVQLNIYIYIYIYKIKVKKHIINLKFEIIIL